MKTLRIIIFSLIATTFVCGNDNVSNLISRLRNLNTINDKKMPISEQSKIYEESMIAKKELLKLAVTNKNITVIIGDELLNTPLSKNRSYGDLLYNFELTDILEKHNINLLISCVDKILDSTNWSGMITCNLLSKTLKSRRLKIPRDDLDNNALSNLFLKAANDKRYVVKLAAIRGLVGIDPLYAKATREYIIAPIDGKNGEIIAKQIIKNTNINERKRKFYDILYQGNLAKSEYINYLKEEMSNTNLHLFTKTKIAEKLLTIKGIDEKEVDKLRNECKNLREKKQREAKAANYDAESKEKQKGYRLGLLEINAEKLLDQDRGAEAPRDVLLGSMSFLGGEAIIVDSIIKVKWY